MQTVVKLARVAEAVHAWGDLNEIIASLWTQKIAEPPPLPYPLAGRSEQDEKDAVPFDVSFSMTSRPRPPVGAR